MKRGRAREREEGIDEEGSPEKGYWGGDGDLVTPSGLTAYFAAGGAVATAAWEILASN